MIVTAALTEGQAQVLEKLKGAFTPSFAPSTLEELMREAADIKVGCGISVTVEKAKAVADALYS